jgi:hypothetical protein
VAVTELAEVSAAYVFGEMIAMAGIPIVGLILLIVGLRQRSRSRPLTPPGYPPAAPYPYRPPVPPPPTPSYPTSYPPRPARSGTPLIVVGSLVLACSLLGILGQASDLLAQHGTSAHSPEVGQCISESDVRQKHVNATPQDCLQPDAIFEVVSKGGASTNCPDGKLRDSQYGVLGDDSTTLCLMLNFQKGKCYAARGEIPNPTFTPSACDGSTSTFVVAERIDGSSDAASCPAGTKAVSYPEPVARLYCLGRVEN